MTTRILFVHALSPLHAGTGQSVGAIDLAIARDRATGHPYLPGSSQKGALRDRALGGGLDTDRALKLFGPETANASDHAGGVAFGDANLLLLPVRSIAGTFAWATSPWLLSRFARDHREAGLGATPAVPALSQGALEWCATATGSLLGTRVQGQNRVVFEDLDLQPQAALASDADRWAGTIGQALFPGDTGWQALLKQRLCIVHDDIMAFFARHGTNVVARIALESDKKTVANLWYEESLPAETVLSALVVAMPNSRTGDATTLLADLEALVGTPIQLGGNATVGRGRCRLVLTGGAA